MPRPVEHRCGGTGCRVRRELGSASLLKHDERSREWLEINVERQAVGG